LFGKVKRRIDREGMKKGKTLSQKWNKRGWKSQKEPFLDIKQRVRDEATVYPIRANERIPTGVGVVESGKAG